MFKIFFVVLVIVLGVFLYLRSAKGNQQQIAENIRLAEAFLVENGQKPEVQSLPSGLQYQVLQKGEGTIHPTATDKVTVHYHGTLLDGTVFDSSVQRGEPLTFGLNQVIKGWTEGVQLMVVGEKTRFFIPSQLAYGNRDAGKISGGSLLIFDVELIGIK